MSAKEIIELTQEQKEQEKLLLSKIMDKIKQTKARNRFANTNFLDLAEQKEAQDLLNKRKEENYIFNGGYPQSERKMFISLPETNEDINKIIEQIISIVRVTIPKENQGTYEHSVYLGGLMKLGIKREMIGDILVRPDGADIIISKEIEKFISENIKELTRFQKSTIEIKSINELKYIETEKQIFKINVPSLRLDAVVSELARCSRSKASEYLEQGRIFVNFKQEIRGKITIPENTYITIRGKGRYKINNIINNTRSGRINLEVEK